MSRIHTNNIAHHVITIHNIIIVYVTLNLIILKLCTLYILYYNIVIRIKWKCQMFTTATYYLIYLVHT